MAVTPTTETPRAAPSTRPLRILVVDDDPLQLRALERAMRGQHNVELTALANPIDALVMTTSMSQVSSLALMRRHASRPSRPGM